MTNLFASLPVIVKLETCLFSESFACNFMIFASPSFKESVLQSISGEINVIDNFSSQNSIELYKKN